jgi:hypothetical protein
MWDAGVVHEASYWTHGRARRMARTACLTVMVVTGSLAAGIAAGVATATSVHAPAHESWAASHGSSNHQPPSGAVVVGFSVTLLVFVAMGIGYALHERRSNPDKEYRTKYESGLTRRQYLCRLGIIELGLVVLCIAGLGWRHVYG